MLFKNHNNKKLKEEPFAQEFDLEEKKSFLQPEFESK